MNQEGKKTLITVVSIYVFLVTIVVLNTYIRHQWKPFVTTETAFQFVGFAGYLLLGFYLLAKMWTKSLGLQKILPLTGTIGVAISMTHNFSLLFNSFYFDLITSGNTPYWRLFLSFEAIFCFFIVVGIFLIIIRLTDRLIQKSVPEWVAGARQLEVFGAIFTAILLMIFKYLNTDWKIWISMRQSMENLFWRQYFPPISLTMTVLLIIILFVSAIYFIVKTLRNQ